MTLTTHAIVGAAIASVMPQNPVLGFAVGFSSHFLLDSIPHWDYKLLSSKEDPENHLNDDLVLNKYFIFDLFKIGADALLGTVVVFFLFIYPNFNFHSVFYSLLTSTVFWSLVGALLPDALQFCYFKWRHEPLLSLQKFHELIHGYKIPNRRYVLGTSLQIIFIIAIVAIVKFIV
jgi:hypothetical protein